jgi:hypothetical protein
MSRELLSLVETYRGLPRGFARAWCETARSLSKRLGERRARDFLAEVVELRGIPEPALLVWIAVRAIGDLPAARLRVRPFAPLWRATQISRSASQALSQGVVGRCAMKRFTLRRSNCASA